MAAQKLEADGGATTLFLEGASGSTHNLKLTPTEAYERIVASVSDAAKAAAPLEGGLVDGKRRQIEVTVRKFDEQQQEEAVGFYCRKRMPAPAAQKTIEVFSDMRRKLAGSQGQKRKTWVQAIRIGDVAIVGVPAEFFTQLGIDIKKASPFAHTIVAELANDWVGYVGNRDAYDLGGYQLWMGLHSWTERGTGEQMVQAALELLNELKAK
jgi:hypothetical protein